MRTTRSASSLQARRSLGQNFLVDTDILDRMESEVQQALTWSPQEQAAVLEIGPGMGALTERVLKVSSVVAVEKDPRAVAYLKEHLAIGDTTSSVGTSLTLHEADVLQCKPDELLPEAPKHLCVGNLPYNISSDFLIWFCNHKDAFTGGVFLLQKEVVERIASPVGTKAYGRITALVSLHFDVFPLFDVPPQAFRPIPKVMSSFAALRPKRFSFANETLRKTFEKTTAALFSQRRKMLRKSLQHLFKVMNIPYAENESAVEQLLQKHGVSLTDRSESLSPQGFLDLAEMFHNMSQTKTKGRGHL